MRDYKKKMDAVKLPPDRYRELRRFCLAANSESAYQVIKSAAEEVTDDALAAYIAAHVTSKNHKITDMIGEGMPCNADTFRVYRARFFWRLDRKLRGCDTNGRESTS